MSAATPRERKRLADLVAAVERAQRERMLILTLPWPPSVNTYWRHPTRGKLAGRHLISEHGRAYRNAVQQLALAERWGKVPSGARVSVQIDAWMPDRRKRDLDNLLKVALDSLTHAGVWNDDSQVDHLSIRRMPMVGGMLNVKIAEIGVSGE